MKRYLLGTIAAMVFGAAIGSAQAAPITGELSLNGSNTFTATATSFSITFQNPGNIGGTSGSFQTVFGAVPPEILSVVTMNNIANTSSNFVLYSATVGANTTSLDAGSISSFTFTPGTPLESLSVQGKGTLHLTGFDPTPGVFDLTTQGPSGGIANVTFSSTQVPVGVPEPTSFTVLGLGLIGLGALRYRIWSY